MENLALILNAKREAYGIEDIRSKTMTVRQLIDYLEQFDDETPVVLSHDNGYTYGSIREYDFQDEEPNENNY